MSKYKRVILKDRDYNVLEQMCEVSCLVAYKKMLNVRDMKVGTKEFSPFQIRLHKKLMEFMGLYNG